MTKAYDKCWLEVGVREDDVGQSVGQHQVEAELRHGLGARVAEHHLAQFHRPTAVIHSTTDMHPPAIRACQ